MDLEERRLRAEGGGDVEKLLYAFALEHEGKMFDAGNVYASLLKRGLVHHSGVFYGGVRCGLPLIEENPANNVGFVRLHNVFLEQGYGKLDWGLERLSREVVVFPPSVMEYTASSLMLKKAEVLGVQGDLVERVWGLFREDLAAEAVDALRGGESDHPQGNAFLSLATSPFVRPVVMAGKGYT